jgi:hypothetical protein
MRARIHKRLLVGLALAAALTAPAAAAQSPDAGTVPPELSYIQAPGGNNDLDRWQTFRGGPGGGGPVFPSDYLGHELGGPASVGLVETQSPAAAISGNDFDWADAAVGAGFVAGLALLVAAGVLALRKRRTLAHA